MTDLPATDPPRRGRRKHAGRHIKLPNGDTWCRAANSPRTNSASPRNR